MTKRIIVLLKYPNYQNKCDKEQIIYYRLLQYLSVNLLRLTLDYYQR